MGNDVPHYLRLPTMNTGFRIIPFLLLTWTGILLDVNCLYAIESGVYLLKKSQSDTALEFPGGYPAEIDRKLERSEYDLEVVSAANANDLFEIRLTSKMGDRPGDVYLAIAVGDKVIVETGGNHWFDKCDNETAVKVAALVGRTPYMRRNVGKSLAVAFVPRKKLYRGREPIEFVVRVTNAGTESLFMQGELPSKDRSASMDLILDEGSPVGCKDVRIKTGKVSVGEPRGELKPGEVKELRQENLRLWFLPTRTGRPSFKVIYQIQIFENLTAAYPVWVEHFAGDFAFDYESGR